METAMIDRQLMEASQLWLSFRSTLFFVIAQRITRALESNYNLIVVTLITAVLVIIGIRFKVLIDIGVVPYSNRFTEAGFAIVAWVLGYVNQLLTQFAATTFGQYLEYVLPSGESQLHDTVPIAVVTMFFFGIANRIYQPYSNKPT